jgi:hypothetical protein
LSFGYVMLKRHQGSLVHIASVRVGFGKVVRIASVRVGFGKVIDHFRFYVVTFFYIFKRSCSKKCSTSLDFI